MGNLLKGILFGLLAGIIIGWWMAEDYENRQFVNDPEIQRSIAERERMKAMERLINEM